MIHSLLYGLNDNKSLPEGEGTTVMGVDARRSQKRAVLSCEPLANIQPPQV